MRIPHRVPWWVTPKPEPISERYQAEVDASTNRLARRHEAAQKRLANAEAKARRIAPLGPVVRDKKATAAWREVERLLSEVAEIERLMQPGNHAPAEHRGVKSYRKVPR